MVRNSPSHYGWRTMADGDGVSIFGSSHIWVDHCSLSSCADGLIDAIIGSTAITISNNYFTKCRHGYFHVVNNDYKHWKMYANGGSADPTINNQGKRYLAPLNPFSKEVTKRVNTDGSVWKGWNWRSEGDMLLNGAYFTPSSAGASASYSRASSLSAKSSSLVGSITSGAGALACRRGSQC